MRHRGITIFSLLHRILGGAYWRKLQAWQASWAHPSLHGARKGGEILTDAWELQADIEAASVEGEGCAGVLLDYVKFFDLFHPDLAHLLLERAGLPPQLVSQLTSLYSGLTRYIRVAGTYGAVVRQTNGCPQGCSFSLFIANLYVTMLFRYIEHEYPEASMGAFLDDRNIRLADVPKLKEIIEKVCAFDRMAGHNTNVEKSAVFANSNALREELRTIKIDGVCPKTSLAETMVGHTIVTRRLIGQTTSLMNQRAEETIKRASRIERSDLPPRQKRLLIESAAIPVSWCGCQWNLPRADLQARAANTVVAALWGRRRKMRAKEMVLAVLHDPTKVDPMASMLYKRLLDARRALRRSECRLHHAMHVNAMIAEDAAPAAIGPVYGLRQAANALGGQLRSDADGLYIYFVDGEPKLPITNYPCSLWKKRLKDRIRKKHNFVVKQ